jgi:hypothetical protein
VIPFSGRMFTKALNSVLPTIAITFAICRAIGFILEDIVTPKLTIINKSIGTPNNGQRK